MGKVIGRFSGTCSKYPLARLTYSDPGKLVFHGNLDLWVNLPVGFSWVYLYWSTGYPDSCPALLQAGEGVISNLPHDQGELPKGIQEGDEVVEVAKLDDEWECINTGDFMRGMAATMAKADALELTYEEAHSWSDWPEWQKAIEVELNTLKNTGTWEIVERPPNVNIVNLKWVFHVKKDTNRSISKWKARLIACGFTQVYGVDYFEMFTPVTKLVLIQSILAIAACNNWDITMFDFHGTYLNGQLNKDIYMEQPPDYEMVDCGHYIVKLHKTLYGLKQAGKKWYDLLCCSLADIGFKKMEANPAIFYVHSGNDIVILTIHVNDSTMTGSSAILQQEYKACISAKFELTNLGPISWLLGLTITHDHAACTLLLPKCIY